MNSQFRLIFPWLHYSPLLALLGFLWLYAVACASQVWLFVRLSTKGKVLYYISQNTVPTITPIFYFLLCIFNFLEERGRWWSGGRSERDARYIPLFLPARHQPGLCSFVSSFPIFLLSSFFCKKDFSVMRQCPPREKRTSCCRSQGLPRPTCPAYYKASTVPCRIGPFFVVLV